MELDESISPVAVGTTSTPSTSTPHSTGQRTSCDSCKRSKLKCKKEPREEKCTRCIARNTECTVTLVSRKKREKKTHYLSAIEDRMKRMESAMNASGITIDDPIEPTIPAVASQSASSLEDKLSIFMINDDGVSGFVGPSSGFSLFSPQGLRWISERTGSRHFENCIRKVAHSCDSVVFPNTFMPNHGEPEPLPDMATAKQYIETYFATFNCAYPLYDKDTVTTRFQKDYYITTRESDPAWYASLNIIFLIGRGVARKDNGRDFVCERYFNNASSVFTELLFDSPSLLAVQAMIGMAFVMQAGEDPHPAYVLVGTASRLAQSIGLHRRLDGYGLSPRDVEMRRNVFWIALGLEKGISIRSGRPSVFSDDDIGVELPPKDPRANKDLDKPDSVLDSFRSVATLALLESRVYSKLYSARSHTKSELERLKWVGALDTELAQWRDELPVMIRPESPIRCHSKHLMHVIMMHFAYYNCLVAIHRGSVHHGSWINTKKPETVRDAKSLGLNPRVFESGAICLKAARQVIGLLHHYDTGKTISDAEVGTVRSVPASSCSVPEPSRQTPESFRPNPLDPVVTSGIFGHCPPIRKTEAGAEEEHVNLWQPRITNLPSMCNYYPLAASLTLFANILQNPTAPSALPDIALMHCVTSILTTNFSAASNPRSSIHLEIFKQILSVAVNFVAKARGEDPSTYRDLGALKLPDTYKTQSVMGSAFGSDWGGQSGDGSNRVGSDIKREASDSQSRSASHSGGEHDDGAAANSATTPGSGSGGCQAQGYRSRHYHMEFMPPVDTPSPGPPPYIPQIPGAGLVTSGGASIAEMQTRGSVMNATTATRTPSMKAAINFSRNIHGHGQGHPLHNSSRSGTESPPIILNQPPPPTGLINAIGGGTGCFQHSGSGLRGDAHFCDGNHLNGVPIINDNVAMNPPHTPNLSRNQSMSDLRAMQQTPTANIVSSNAPPYVPQSHNSALLQQQSMGENFDFNQYDWQPGTGGPPPPSQNNGFAAEGEMNYEEFMGQPMEGQEGDFLPMVFQWDLADIWGGQNGLGGMGGGGMGV